VKLWEVRSSGVPEQPILSLTDQVLGVVYGVAFSGDGTHLLAAGQREVKIWDVSLDGDAEWAHLPSAADDIPFVKFLPGGSRLLANSPGGGAVTIWDLNTRRQIRTIRTTTVGVVNAAAVSADGRVIAAGGRISQTSNANGFAAWDAATGRQRFSLHGDNVNGLAISADGRHVASVDLDGRARIVDRSGRQVSVFKVGAAGIVMLAHDDASRVSRVQFSPDGARIAVVAQNDRGRQQLEIWDWRKKTVVGRLNAGAFVDFDPTGFRVVTADGGGRGEIVNLQSGKRVAVLAAQPGSLEQAAFSPDGSLVATAGTDGAVRLFDAHTGGEQLTLPSAACPVTDVSFSQDGTKLASASLCDGVRVWALDIDDLLRIARQKVTRSLTPQECRQYLRTDRCPRS
jgi:WD40 repeat protein